MHARVTAHDETGLCCGCGEESDVLQWIEEAHHWLCGGCAAEFNRAVWTRIKHGVEPKNGLSGVQTAFAETASAVPWRCVLALDEVPLCFVPPMKLALVAGVHPPDLINGWVLLSRTGEPTGDERLARLFPFTREGAALAHQASHEWDEIVAPLAWVNFAARVLVVGLWDQPDEVTPVWCLDGSGRPQHTPYPWD
jgi:hypothetical protein